mmetsp:Transcript_10374/g.22717  ORF Transcript_10374/g.22717 Transcript_10374/m.22717 type:complete len:269 (+) Transcript_10374:1196-2002(+)
MQTHRDTIPASHVPLDHRHHRLLPHNGLEHVQPHLVIDVLQLALRGGLLDHAHGALGAAHVELRVGLGVGLEHIHRDQGDPVLGGELLGVPQAKHSPISMHHLGNSSDLLHAGKSAEVVGRLGVPTSLQDAALPGAQGKHVPGLAKIVRLALRVAHGSDGGHSVGGGDAGGGAWEVVRGHVEGGGVLVGVGPGGGVKPQALQMLLVRDNANDPSALTDHEGHLLRCDLLPVDNEITLILAVRGIHHCHELPLLEGRQALIHGGDHVGR